MWLAVEMIDVLREFSVASESFATGAFAAVTSRDKSIGKDAGIDVVSVRKMEVLTAPLTAFLRVLTFPVMRAVILKHPANVRR